MNSVVMIGKLVSVGKLEQRGKWQLCRGVISVSRPYKTKDEYKYDSFDFVAWGEYARRIGTAKRGQIIGISAGMLEKDPEGKIYINVKGITFYTTEMADAIGEHQIPDKAMADMGFGAVAVDEIPDF